MCYVQTGQPQKVIVPVSWGVHVKQWKWRIGIVLICKITCKSRSWGHESFGKSEMTTWESSCRSAKSIHVLKLHDNKIQFVHQETGRQKNIYQLMRRKSRTQSVRETVQSVPDTKCNLKFFDVTQRMPGRARSKAMSSWSLAAGSELGCKVRGWGWGVGGCPLGFFPSCESITLLQYQ